MLAQTPQSASLTASALRYPKNASGLRFSSRFSTAAEIPASLLNALPHLPFPGLFHDGPPTARLRRFRSRFICRWQREAGIPPEGEARAGANLGLAFFPALWYDASARKRAYNEKGCS